MPADYESFIGQPLAALPTPAMCVDIDDLDYHIKLLAD